MKRTMGSDLHGWRLGWVWQEQNLIFMEGCMFVNGGSGLDDFQLLLSRDIDHRNPWFEHSLRFVVLEKLTDPVPLGHTYLWQVPPVFVSIVILLNTALLKPHGPTAKGSQDSQDFMSISRFVGARH